MVRLSNEVVDDFKENFVSSEHMGTTYMILTSLYNKDYDFLDKLDDSNKDRKMIMLYRDLVYKGYLLENTDDSEVHFSLTDKAISLLGKKEHTFEELISEFKDEVKETVEKVIDTVKKRGRPPKAVRAIPYIEEISDEVNEVKKEEEKEKIEDWIDDWRNMFPRNAKAHHYPLRTGAGTCTNKMKIFMDKHPDITKETIFNATKLYLKEEERRGFEYTQQAGNFIMKSEGGKGSVRNSNLETYCDRVLNDPDPNSNYTDLEDNNPFI